MGILEDDCQPVFAGVNFVFSPAADLSQDKQIGFHSHLLQRQVDIDQTRREGATLLYLRTGGSPLQVQVMTQPGASLGQLLILADRPQYTFEMVKKEFDEVVAAYEDTWHLSQQVIARDATMRFLFPTTDKHAFQYLWEERLGQRESALAGLGRPVLGGGVRLVMPSTADYECQIEFKVESFLRDSSKLFLETQFLWQKPQTPGERMHPMELLDHVYDFTKGPGLLFAAGNSQEGWR
ncbi:MAG: hypothetical protein ACOX8V_01575 [Thermoleophilia bacterium]|jgi:hypothetical protein